MYTKEKALGGLDSNRFQVGVPFACDSSPMHRNAEHITLGCKAIRPYNPFLIVGSNPSSGPWLRKLLNCPVGATAKPN